MGVLTNNFMNVCASHAPIIYIYGYKIWLLVAVGCIETIFLTVKK